MSKNLKTASPAVLAAAGLASSAPAAENQELNDLLQKIKGPDDNARTEAWQSAAGLGAPAIKPLFALLTDPNLEVARAAKRGMWKIVHSVGRPGADAEKKAIVAELLPLLKSDNVAVRREIIWMLSEIGSNESVATLASLLRDKDSREDARAALIRIPGDRARAAFNSALEWAPADFKPALAEALRDKGVKVDAYPSEKLRPTKATTVKPGA